MYKSVFRLIDAKQMEASSTFQETSHLIKRTKDELQSFSPESHQMEILIVHKIKEGKSICTLNNIVRKHKLISNFDESFFSSQPVIGSTYTHLNPDPEFNGPTYRHLNLIPTPKISLPEKPPLVTVDPANSE